MKIVKSAACVLLKVVNKARSTPATVSKQHFRSNWQLCCLLLRHCCHFWQQCPSNVRLCRSNTRLCILRQCCFDILCGLDGVRDYHSIVLLLCVIIFKCRHQTAPQYFPKLCVPLQLVQVVATYVLQLVAICKC